MLDGNGRWQTVMSQPHPSLRCADRYSYSMLMGFRCDAVRVVDSSSSATAAGSFLKEFWPELSSCNSDADCYVAKGVRLRMSTQARVVNSSSLAPQAVADVPQDSVGAGAFAAAKHGLNAVNLLTEVVQTSMRRGTPPGPGRPKRTGQQRQLPQLCAVSRLHKFSRFRGCDVPLLRRHGSCGRRRFHTFGFDTVWRGLPGNW